MQTLKLEFFFLMIFFISGIQNELRPDAENVCQESETYEETIIEKVKKQVKEYKNIRCGKIFKGFACKKQVINWKAVNEPRVVQKTRAILKCCSGYKETQENITRCVPVCSAECVHGKCTAPDKCTCMPGFHGRACNMRSVATTVRTNSVVESSAQESFQTTEKSETESLTVMSEVLKVTNRDFVTEIAEGVTVSTAEATVTTTDTASCERSMTELDEKDTSKEKFHNAKFTIAVDVELNHPILITASTEEKGMNSKYSNLKEAIGLENGVPNSSEKFSIEGNEIPSNTKPALEFEEHPFEPTKIYGKNLQVYDFTSLLYAFPISCFVLIIALWIIVKRRKKIRELQTEKQHPFYSKEPLEFCVENSFWSKLFHSHSESSIGMPEAEPKSTQPILLGLIQRNHSENQTNIWEAGPNNSEPLLKDIQDYDRSHAIHSEGTFI